MVKVKIKMPFLQDHLMSKEAFPQKLTSNKFNIKNNFHGYGGKSYKCINFKNNIYLIWIDQITNALWFQILKEAASHL